VVHWVGDGTGAFEELGGWEAVLVEGLVVRTAGWGKTELKFWTVKGRNVGDEVGDFWSSNAAGAERISCCGLFGKRDLHVGES